MNTALHIRATSVDITPQHPCQLSGYDNRPLPYDSTSGPIEADLVWLSQGEKRVLLISIDTLFTSRDFKRSVIHEFNARTGNNLREDEMLMIATHTHFAPTLDPGKPVLGKADERFIEQTRKKITDALVTLAGREPQNAHTTFRSTRASYTINRRRRVVYREGLKLKKKIMLGPNPYGMTSKKISVIRFTDEAGKPLALAWHFACHPTDFYELNSLSPAFPGIVREYLRKEMGNIPVLFLQGFAGNVKPWDHKSENLKWKRIKDLVSRSDVFQGPDKNTFMQWVQRLALDVSATSKDKGDKIEIQLGSKLLEKPLSEIFVPEKKRDDTLTLQEITLGKKLRIVSVSAEPVIEYEEYVQKIYPGENVLCCGYTDSVFIYLPTSSQIREGGYECEGFQQKFSYTGRFDPDPGKKILSYLEELRAIH